MEKTQALQWMSGAARFAACALAPIVVMLLCGPQAHALTQQQLNWCNGEDSPTSDQQIDGCTAVIRSGKLKGQDLALAFNRRGFAHHVKGDTERAIRDYEQAIKLDRHSAVPVYNRGQVFADQGRHDQAIRSYDQAIKLDASNALFVFERGVSYAAQGRYDRAIADYDLAIKIDPAYAKAFHSRSLAKGKTGDTAGGEADLAEALRLDPSLRR